MELFPDTIPALHMRIVTGYTVMGYPIPTKVTLDTLSFDI